MDDDLDGSRTGTRGPRKRQPSKKHLATLSIPFFLGDGSRTGTLEKKAASLEAAFLLAVGF
jgi:hypothetical protein